MTPLVKLYVWSVVMEPLMFFVVGHQSVTGIAPNMSRVLQAVVLLMLLYQPGRVSFSRSELHPLHRLNFNYTVYFALACVAGVYGVLSGAYAVSAEYNRDVSGVASILNSAWVRPVFEYVVALYYFLYFMVLPRLLLKSEKDLDYFFSTFFLMFNACLLIGLLDYASYRLLGIDLIARSLYEWRDVGLRFHGLAGEPREAFVYLMLGLALVYLRNYRTGARSKWWWLLAVALAALLTQSASGLLGLALFAGLVFFMAVMRLNKYVLLFSLVVIVVLVPAAQLVVEHTDRLTAYKEALELVWDALENQDDIPVILTGQVNNIYPIYDLVTKARELEFLPLLIGSGFGSASVINNIMGTWGELTNPHSQLIRLIYESGLIGSLFFLFAFYKPMDMVTAHIPAANKRALLILTLLVIGAFLGHRSAAPYIFVGVCIAALRRAPARMPTSQKPPREKATAPALPAAAR